MADLDAPVDPRGYPAARERLVPGGRAVDGVPVGEQQFFAGGAVGAGAAVYSHVQLWNPFESKRVLRVRRVRAAASANITLELRRSAAPLATFVRRGQTTLVAFGGGDGEIRTEAVAPAVGVTILVSRGVTSTDVDLWTGDGLELLPGTGVLVLGGTVNTDVYASFVWDEAAADWRAVARAIPS